MFRDVILGRYFPGNSVLHRLDPRTKLGCALLLMLAVFVVHEITAILVIFALVLGLYFLGRLRWRGAFSNLRSFFWLYAITFVIHLFFHPGESLFSVPDLGLTATREGFHAGVLFTVRIAVLVLLADLFLALTAPQDLTDGIQRMLRPISRLGLPLAEAALAATIALRFVPILSEEAEKIRRAQMSRGADLEGPWLLRLRQTLPMVLPLFACALKRADDLALALEARGYAGGKGRTQMLPLRLGVNDALALGIVSIVTACFWILR